MRGRMRAILVLAIFAALGGACAVPRLQSAQRAPEVERLVRAIRAAYGTCKTYRDSGSQTTARYVDGYQQESNDTLTFKTVFSRPGKFRFEFTERSAVRNRDETCVLWAVGKRENHTFHPTDNLDPPAYTKEVWLASAYYGYDKSRETDITLGMAIAGFTGISGGTAHVVSRFFFPEDIGGLDYLAEKDLKLVGSESVSGRVCDVLESMKLEAKLWFDAETHLLLKLVERMDLGDMPSGSVVAIDTTIYAPLVNVPVKDTEFTGPK